MTDFWKQLGIAETRDSEQIKDAYRQKLRTVNPEDDPEGFKALRSAYEEAMRFSQSEIRVLSEDKSPMGQWKIKLREIYESFPKRIGEDAWKELLEDDICVGLDTWNEAREALLTFLMEHYRLPNNIWIFLDDKFHIIEDTKELAEQFPPQFLEFVKGMVAQIGAIDYALFEGAETVDYDNYIDLYFRLKTEVDQGNEMNQTLLSEMKESSIYHPYVDVECSRVYMKDGKERESLGILEDLKERYPKDIYILYCFAQLKWQMGSKEEAYNNYQYVLELYPSHFSAKMGIADYDMEIGEYLKAKDLYLELLEVDLQNQASVEGMRKANEHLMRSYEEKIQANPKDIDSQVELGWCFFQNERFAESIKVLESVVPDEENHLHYHNLKGRTYICLNEYEKALEHILLWIQAIKELKDDGTVKTRKRIRRLSYAYYTAASCYMAPESEKLGTGDEALSYLNLALEFEEEQNQKQIYQNAKSRLLFRLKRYEESVDASDLLIEWNREYYPAYLSRQEACFELEHYQGVINDYYTAVDIYPHYFQPYKMALKTFWYFRDQEAGMNVIKRAESVDLKSQELILYKARNLRLGAKEDEDTLKAFELCKELMEQLEDKDSDLEKKSEVFYEAAICMMDMLRYEEALSNINQALRMDSSEINYEFLKANIYVEQEKYEEALTIYQSLDEQRPNNGVVLFRIAEAYKVYGKIEKAVEYYNKALEASPDHQTANFSLMRIYKERWEDDENSEDFHKAIAFADRQLELAPGDYYYIERGLLYLEHDDTKEAIEDFQKALEYDEHNPYAYNNIGTAYMYQKEYKKAIEYFEKAALEPEGGKTTLTYRHMGQCYEVLADYEQAHICYKKNQEYFPETPSSYTDLGEFLYKRQRFQEALDSFTKGMELPRASRYFYMIWLGDVYKEMGDRKNALRHYNKVISENSNSKDYNYIKAMKKLGNFYFEIEGDNAKAIGEYMKVISSMDPIMDAEYAVYCMEIGNAWKNIGKEAKAKEFYEKAIQNFKRGTEDFKKYLSYPGHIPARYYKLGCAFFYLGDMVKAKEFFGQILLNQTCHNCTYAICYEDLLGKGMICEAEGDIKGAIAYYDQVIAIDFDDMEARCRRRALLGERPSKGGFLSRFFHKLIGKNNPNIPE